MATPTINEIGKYYLAVSPKRREMWMRVNIYKFLPKYLFLVTWIDGQEALKVVAAMTNLKTIDTQTRSAIYISYQPIQKSSGVC